MRAITLWQPYAAAVELGLKQNETRGWATPYCGDVAIHAARLQNVELKRTFDNMPGRVRQAFDAKRYFSFTNLQFGAVVAVVSLVKCVQVGPSVVFDLNPVEKYFGDYSDGRYVWLLTNIRPLKWPVKCQGRQGFFSVDIPPDAIGDRIDQEITML